MARSACCGSSPQSHRLTGTFLRVERDGGQTAVVWRDKASGEERRSQTRAVIGADSARSPVARAEVPGVRDIPCVIAYHEIIEAPKSGAAYHPERCDVIHDGRISPDFYGWVFPQCDKASVGMGIGVDGVVLTKATADLRAACGLSDCTTIRREGAPIPLCPPDRWDNGRDLVLAGKLFMKEHGTVFKVLRPMRDACYKSDERRERFVSLCQDIDVQRLTFEACMNKRLVKTRPLAHLKIGVKNVAHLMGLVSPTWS